MKRYILLLSGGVGSRYEADTPKQYTKSENGDYYIKNSIRPFVKLSDKFEGIIVVCAPEYKKFISELFEGEIGNINLHFAMHGSTRQESINNGIDKINEINKKDGGQVFIQEAVRPFVSTRLINELITADEKYGSVSPSVNPFVLYSKFDTKNGQAYELMDKGTMVELQLPKRYDINKYNHYRSMHEGDHLNLIDESVYFMEQNEMTHCVKGSFENIKITRPVHRWIAEAIDKYNKNK